MKIRYDDKGQILAVGDDGCDWPEPLLKLAAKDLPPDLLGAMGHYVVRKGKLAKAAGAAAAFDAPAALRAAGGVAPVAALFEPGGLALAVAGVVVPRPRAAKATTKAAVKAPAAKKKVPAAKTGRRK